MVAIRHSSCPRWNPPPTYPAVLISCVVVTACRVFAGGRGSNKPTQYFLDRRRDSRTGLVGNQTCPYRLAHLWKFLTQLLVYAVCQCGSQVVFIVCVESPHSNRD